MIVILLLIGICLAFRIGLAWGRVLEAELWEDAYGELLYVYQRAVARRYQSNKHALKSVVGPKTCA